MKIESIICLKRVIITIFSTSSSECYQITCVDRLVIVYSHQRRFSRAEEAVRAARELIEIITNN